MRTRFKRTNIFGAHRFNAWELQNGALIVRAIQVSQHKIDMPGQKQTIECFHGIWQLNQLLLFESDHPMITLSKNQQGKGMCSHILHPMFPKVLFFFGCRTTVSAKQSFVKMQHVKSFSEIGCIVIATHFKN
jgi:hypothetical protein